MDITTILLGILAGVSYALTGWAKAQGEDFDWLKLLSTALIGGISGAVMLITQWDIPTSYTFLLNLGIVPIIENLLKAFWRKIYVPVAAKIAQRKKL